jgi:molecular chaperone GrpE (heat shock protein)
LSQLIQQIAEDRAQTAVSPDLSVVNNELRKLGKTQFKANTLAASQTEQWQTALTELTAAQAQNQELITQLQQQQQQAANQALLLSLLPMLDDLEKALENGRLQLSQLDSPLSSWIDGLRLIYDRFLAVLARNGVKPIATIGKRFDPYAHRAVGITNSVPAGTAPVPPGHIVTEERRGYQTAVGVLRYADVIVYKPE